jgi:hypothetical protein
MKKQRNSRKNRRSIQLVPECAILLRSALKGYSMKKRIFVGLCVALGASFISARADDNTVQATASTNDTPAQAAGL